MKDYVEDTNAIVGDATEKPRKVDLFETPDMFLGVLVLRKGQVQKDHKHEREDKAYLVLSGCPTIRLGEDELRARPGQIVFCPKGIPHGAGNEEAEDARLLVFMAPHPRPGTLPTGGAS